MAEEFNKELDKLLRYDAFAEAEKNTGKSYKESKFTETLGMIDFFQHIQKKNAVLQALGDTTYTNTEKKYRSVLAQLGFECVLEIPFTGELVGSTQTHPEVQCFYFHKDYGVLCEFDTYHGNINGSKLYFNWISHDQKHPWPDRFSGSCCDQKLDDKWVCYGDIDAREALIHQFRKMEREGKFVTPWLQRPHLWFLHYMDERQIKDDWYQKRIFDKINQEKIVFLPEYVQKAITPNR